VVVLAVFFVFIFFVMLFRVIFDAFRSQDLSGWGKTGWLLFILVLPVLAPFIYVIARGKDMAHRDVAQAHQMQQQEEDAYIREAASSKQDATSQIAQAYLNQWIKVGSPGS
jgi:NADH:ubiquinone oxidoreductase subunit 6 (subunit J)